MNCILLLLAFKLFGSISYVLGSTFDDLLRLSELVKNTTNEFPFAEKLRPKIAVIGVQSAGKSSFIEYFTKIALSYIGVDTATRSPVEYQMHQDSAYPNDPYVLMKLPGRPKEIVPFRELTLKLKIYMDSLGRSFSKEPVLVEIHSRKVMNIVFADIPGLIANPQDQNEAREAEEVSKIVAEYARDPSYKIVAILKSSDEYTTNVDIAFLNDQVFFKDDPSLTFPPRKDWEESAVKVVNRINLQLPNVNSADAANKLFKVRRNTQNVFFVSLKPDSSWNRNTASFDEVQDRIRTLSDQEAQLYKSWKVSLLDPHEWNPDNDERLGLVNAEEAILHMFDEAVQTFVKTLKCNIRDELEVVEQQLVDVNWEVDQIDPEATRLLLKSFVKEFFEHIQKVQNMGTMNPTDTMLDGNSYCADNYGRDLESEISSSLLLQKNADTWSKKGFYISTEDMLTILPTKDTFTSKWGLKLIGLSSYERWKDYYTYMLLSHNISHTSRNAIETLAQDNRNGLKSGFPTEKITTQIARMKLTDAKGGIHWFSHALQVSSDYCLDVVLTHLLKVSGRYKLLALNGVVRTIISEYYKEEVRKLLDKIISRWNEDIEIHSTTIQVDLPVKAILSLMLVPQEALLGDSESYNRSPPMNIFPNSITTESVDAIPGDQMLSRTENREQNSNPDRWKQLFLRFVNIRSAVKQLQVGIGISDYINGGFVSLPPMDKNNYDLSFLISAATEYYMNIIFTVIRNLDAYFYSFFYDKVTDSASYLDNSDTDN